MPLPSRSDLEAMIAACEERKKALEEPRDGHRDLAGHVMSNALKNAVAVTEAKLTEYAAQMDEVVRVLRSLLALPNYPGFPTFELPDGLLAELEKEQNTMDKAVAIYAVPPATTLRSVLTTTPKLANK